MKKMKLVAEQTLMVSFMVLCYVSIYGLVILRKDNDYFDWFIPGSIVITSFLCSLITVFFLFEHQDPKDQSKLNFRLRSVIHFILLYLLIMGCGYLFRWYTGTLGFIMTSVIYVIIYHGTCLGTILIFKHEEKIISDALEKIRDEE